MEFDKILDYQESDNEFEPYYRIVQSKAIESYLWYKKHKSSARRWFRFSGAIVIIFSVSIPALSAYRFDGKNFTIAIMALLIAVLSGLNTFLGWGEKWQGRSRSELAIKHLIGLWQLELQKAKLLNDPDSRSKAAADVTDNLLEEVGKIVSHETENFFSNVHWPKKQG